MTIVDKRLGVVLGVWFLINLVQASSLNLTPDEAYYWLWSRHLDWGYFEHPPLVALSIRLGYSIIPSELGVRLLALIYSSLSIWVVYKTIDQPNLTLFGCLIFSTVGMHVAGFSGGPEGPFIFFTTLFFFFVKKYIDHDTIGNALILAAIIALMLYSKHSAILPIVFTVMANVPFLRRKTFWLIVGLSSILYLPHVLWQIDHDFVSFKYNLFERFNVSPADALANPFGRATRAWPVFFNYTTEYILGQFLVTGPLIGFITIMAGFRYKPQTPFERTLKLNLVATLAFFIFISFKGRVLPHWTSPMLASLFVLSHAYISGKVQLKRVVYCLSVVSILLIGVARVQATYKVVPIPNPTGRFNDWKTFADDVKKLSNGIPVVAEDYVIASELSFYTGGIVPLINARKSQFDLWNFQRDFKGKVVLLLSPDSLPSSIPIETPTGKTFYAVRVKL
jgi:hypothetical protein